MERIGRYRIKARLRDGDLTAVYLATDPQTEQIVAITLLPPTLLADEAGRIHFQRTAERLRRLEHPAIIPVYDYGEAEGRPYLVTGHVEGPTLAARLAGRALPMAETTAVVERLAGALDYAHAQGIIHGALQPATIRFDADSRAYLSDFGLMALAQAAAPAERDAALDAPAYTSPEQVEAGGEIGPRTDIYALGAILFEMLSGRLPYEAETPARLRRAHLLQPIPRILELRPELPYRCSTLINQALAKDPDNRFPTATALWQSLQKAAAEVDATVVEMSPLETTAAAKKGVEQKKAALESALEEAVAASEQALAERIAQSDLLEAVDPRAATVEPAQLPPAKESTTRAADRRPPPGSRGKAPADAPAPKPRRRKFLLLALIGSGLLALACLGFFASLFLATPAESNPWAPVDQHATSEVVAGGSAEATRGEDGRSGLTTRMARAAATATAQKQIVAAGATATAEAEAIATGTATAAAEEAQAAVREARRGDPLYGPATGELVHALDGFIKSEYADVAVRDFLVQVTYTNPYTISAGSWDVGFMFREDDLNSQYRLALQSDGGWTLVNRSGDADTLIQQGTVANLNVATGETNDLQLLVQGERGYLFLNEQYVTTLDLSARMTDGDVGVATSMYEGNEIAGESTGFEGFTLWALEP